MMVIALPSDFRKEDTDYVCMNVQLEQTLIIYTSLDLLLFFNIIMNIVMK